MSLYHSLWKSVVLNGPVRKPQLLQLIAILAAAQIKQILFKVDADLALSCLLATLGRERGRGVVSAFPFSDVGSYFCVVLGTVKFSQIMGYGNSMVGGYNSFS